MKKSRDQKRREAQERQERWNNMSTSEKLEQKIQQGHEDTVEAGALAIQLEKELVE